MDAKQLKDLLTVDDIISIVTKDLGSNGNEWDSHGNPIFQTICHNPPGHGKYKLYYYVDTKTFVCYTECNIHADIYELVRVVKHLNSFKDAYYYVANYFGYDGSSKELEEFKEITSDWDLLNRYDDINNIDNSAVTTPTISHNLLEYFSPICPEAWYKEGIDVETMKSYNIKMDVSMEKIIIPHYDIEGNLIGIRGRSFNELELAEGKKYAPVYIENTMYNHPIGDHLYGLNFNKEAIIKSKKAVIFEGEKSVLKAQTFYKDNNFCVAACGSSISDKQVELLLSLGVNEIIIAFDKENDDIIGSEKTVKYREKLETLAAKFSPYVNTYILLDLYQKLEYKDSPIDKGKDTLEFLLEHKILIPSFSINRTKGRKNGKNRKI